MLQPLLRHQKNDTTEISGKFLGNDDEIEEESEMSKGMIITKENGEDEDDDGDDDDGGKENDNGDVVDNMENYNKKEISSSVGRNKNLSDVSDGSELVNVDEESNDYNEDYGKNSNVSPVDLTNRNLDMDQSKSNNNSSSVVEPGQPSVVPQRRNLAFSVENILDPNKFTGNSLNKFNNDTINNPSSNNNNNNHVNNNNNNNNLIIPDQRFQSSIGKILQPPPGCCWRPQIQDGGESEDRDDNSEGNQNPPHHHHFNSNLFVLSFKLKSKVGGETITTGTTSALNPHPPQSPLNSSPTLKKKKEIFFFVLLKSNRQLSPSTFIFLTLRFNPII
ncbi:serine-rich 25 kDa antigen protein, putative [Pediculus humanus corporis]|uniref:Serine-rich 25 kDa antigen protein, putative n=1 Tax=Pediculus humanus subsp. corporis TaxID=121224 RepID=E0VTJ0_PEDHC|nr:serine-rich 25 kDa antigen protein, putative [Pediculus humanus corporis]EEB16717.1 serine-rich 25 kDa antigen protein, putative [Pediculus humanus corporis]